MSFDMWHASMYGTMLPEKPPELERFRGWVLSNAGALELSERERSEVERAETSEQVIETLDERSLSGAPIGDAVVATLPTLYISALRGSDDGDMDVVGIIAAEVYPWTQIPFEQWGEITPEWVRDCVTNALRPLYGDDFEPKFDYLDVRSWG